MTDKIPTQEQIKEFWEWVGFKEEFEVDTGVEFVVYPDGKANNDFPITDLNNLFKYAVPKFWVYMARGVMGYWVVEIRQYGETGINYKRGFAEGYDPTFALFWSIWEVIHG